MAKISFCEDGVGEHRERRRYVDLIAVPDFFTLQCTRTHSENGHWPSRQANLKEWKGRDEFRTAEPTEMKKATAGVPRLWPSSGRAAKRDLPSVQTQYPPAATRCQHTPVHLGVAMKGILRHSKSAALDDGLSRPPFVESDECEPPQCGPLFDCACN